MSTTRLKGTCAAWLAVWLAAACASSGSEPGPEQPTRTVVRIMDFQTSEFFTEGNEVSSTFSVPPQRVWPLLPAVYERLEIPVLEVAPERMTLGNPALEVRRIDGKRLGSYVDCGTTLSGVVANLYDVTLRIATRLTDSPEGGTLMTTSLDAWAEPRTTRGDPIHCRSRNTLETRVAELLAAFLEG